MIEFFIPGKPKGKGRPRFTRSGHAYTPKTTKEYEKLIADVCRVAMCRLQPKIGPVRMVLRVGKVFPREVRSKTAQAKFGRENKPTTTPDLDNVIKAVLDGCNGIAYLDDKQIVSLAADAFYTQEPGVWVKITEA